MNGQTVPQTTTTVVIEEKKRRRAAFWWVAGGAACLLVGGSTFALWQDTSVFTGGTITAGNLDLITDQTPAFYDVSTISGDPNPASATTGLISDATALRLDETAAISNTDGGLGHAIDPTSWRIVPGDTVAVVYNAQITLKGDNLVADLTIANATAATAANGDTDATQNGAAGVTSEDNAAQANDSQEAGPTIANNAGFTDGTNALSYGYALYQDNALLGSGTAPADGTIATFSTAADATASDANGVAVYQVAAGNTSNITVVITVTMNKDLQARQNVTAASTLQGITLSLLQTRSEGAQNG